MTYVPENATLCTCCAIARSYGPHEQKNDCPRCQGRGWYLPAVPIPKMTFSDDEQPTWREYFA